LLKSRKRSFAMRSLRNACLLLHVSFPLMVSVSFWLFVCLCGVAAGRAMSQNAPAAIGATRPRTLAEFLAQISWNPQRDGALLAVDPAGTLRDEAAVTGPEQQAATLRAGLSLFHRAPFAFGALTVIAPTEMVQLVDKPNQPPNFYDGLPASLKVKYLLATLSADQWAKLGKDGLGVSDLMGEQRAVFLSLLPEPFRYTNQPLDDRGYGKAGGASVTLNPQDRQQVKLRVFQQLSMMLPLVDEPRSYTGADFSRWPGQPNGHKLSRDTAGDNRTLYGVSFRSVVPNKLKPADLNYRLPALAAAVSLQQAATVQDLISRIAAATHIEIIADLRVAQLPLFVRGDAARAGDLLRALALAVTGTYRAVDSAYVLTGDLVGLGTRQWRAADWFRDVDTRARQWGEEITTKIAQQGGRNGGINALGFAPNDSYTLSPDQIAEAWRRDNAGGAQVDFDVSTLPPALQQLIHEIAERSPAIQKNRDDRAWITPQFKFGYQLPNGDLLDPEGENLGATERYQPRETTGQDHTPAPRPTPAPGPLPAAEQRFLFMTPDVSKDITGIVAAVRRAGFTDLALNTEEAPLLKAAVLAARGGTGANGMRIYACIAPFRMDSEGKEAAEQADRNINGETAAEVAAARKQSARWKEYLRLVADNTMPMYIPERVIGVTSASAPGQPQMNARFRRIAALARTNGLAGLFLYATQPAGYAGQHQETISIANADGPLVEQGNLGYAPPLRLAFLRQYGVDPLDLIPSNLYFRGDLSHPFFPDPQTSSIRSERLRKTLNSLEPQWNRFRAQLNQDAMTTLYTALRMARPDLPLYVESRDEWDNGHDLLHFRAAYAAWLQPDNLPILKQVRSTSWEVSGDRPQIDPLRFSDLGQTPARTSLLISLAAARERYRQPDASQSLAIDLTALSCDRALSLLDQCITQDKIAATSASDKR
jgi:hypothetical protein